MTALTAYFFKVKNQVKEITWFRTALYLFLLYKAFVYVYHFRSLFSAEKMIYNQPGFIGGIKDLVFVLTNYYSVTLGAVFIVALVLLAFLGLVKRSNYISNLLLWLVMLNLNNFLYSTVTAGDYLLNQLLFFNIFFSIRPGTKAVWNDLKTALHNMALAGIKIQVCLLYVLAGWFKLTDPGWLNGEAVYQVFQIEEYSNALFKALPLCLCMILNYTIMLYQLLFPVLVWLRPFKLYVFAFGILQHLFIAFGMGLLSFGVVMIICYILFLKYDSRPESF